MHQMAQTDKEDYSHQQDMEQFNQTLTTLRERYDDNRRAGIASDNEAEFVAYRLILASLYANSQLENELHSLASDLRHNKRVLTAIEIFKAAKSAFNFGSDKGWVQAQANWKKFWDLIKSPSVSYLMACAAEVSFNRVRHIILDSIWHAYRKGPRGDISVDAWTTDKLKDVLAMDDDKDAVKLCELFGFHFERNAQGQTYLDIAKLGNSNKSIGVPHSVKPQMFSQSLVESKRHNRAFSAVIQGMTVKQAKSSGLLVDPSTIPIGGADSLFIPETAPAKPNIFSQHINGTMTNGTPNPSSFASPFNPPRQPSFGASTPPNPFLNNAFANKTPQIPSGKAGPSPSLGGGASFGLFDAAKNPIKFAPAPEPTANGNPFETASSAFPHNPLRRLQRRLLLSRVERTHRRFLKLHQVTYRLHQAMVKPVTHRPLRQNHSSSLDCLRWVRSHLNSRRALPSTSRFATTTGRRDASHREAKGRGGSTASCAETSGGATQTRKGRGRAESARSPAGTRS